MKDENNRRMIGRQLGPSPVLRLPEGADDSMVKTYRIMVSRGSPDPSRMTQEEWEKECFRRVFGKE